MKRLIYSLLAAFFFIGGCNEENITEPETLRLDNFKEAGLIHNEFLNNAKLNFQESKSISSVEEKIEFVNDFNKKFIDKLKIEENKKEMLRKSLDENKELVRTDFLTTQAFHQNQNGRVSSEDENLFQTIEKIHNDGLISDFGFNLLNKYANDVKSNYDGILSDNELKNNTLQYISDFETYGYPIESGEGQMIGNILSISIYSIEWWEENPDAFEYDSENGRVMIAPWAAADIVGAAWGGATGAIGSYAGTGEVNWTAVGVGALSGAVAGSTGAVGKIAKWLF